MPLHSVRFDEETETALAHVCEATGSSASEVMKRGVVALSRSLTRKVQQRPFDVYLALDLGPGGYARAPARKAKKAVGDIVRRKLTAKHRR